MVSLPESIHCTFVTTATETSRRVDDGTSHALHWVPYPREHHINAVVAFSKLATNPQSVHPFKLPYHFEQPHHAQSSVRALIVTTECSTTTTQRESFTRKLGHPETLRTCVPRYILLLSSRVTPNHRPDTSTRFGHFLPPYMTRLPRVAHRHAKLHIVVRTVAWTFQSPSSTSLPTISMVSLVAVPESQSK